MRLGVIAGTGFAPPSAEQIAVGTPWGEVEVSHWRDGGLGIFFVQRHGAGPAPLDAHRSASAPRFATVPPHGIAHRANVDALSRCNVDAVLAVNAVGAVDPALRVPSLVVPHDLLDLRKTTETFHHSRAVHVDMTEPYCPHLRALLAAHVASTTSVYACVEGPRLETPAEIRMLRTLGATLVGMTGMPEAALARERALCYASVCMVTNPAAGMSVPALSAAQIKAGAEKLAGDAMRAVLAAGRALRDDRTCRCRRALDGAVL